MREQVGVDELVARSLLAALVALASGGSLLFLFAWCTLAGGGLTHGSPQWWWAVLGALFLSFDPGVASWPLTAVLLGSGGVGLHAFGTLLVRIARDLATDADDRSAASGPTLPAGHNPRSPDAEPGAAPDTAR